jgi:outer membrane PBP1 activator LpoA protein
MKKQSITSLITRACAIIAAFVLAGCADRTFAVQKRTLQKQYNTHAIAANEYAQQMDALKFDYAHKCRPKQADALKAKYQSKELTKAQYDWYIDDLIRRIQRTHQEIAQVVAAVLVGAAAGAAGGPAYGPAPMPHIAPPMPH